MKTISQYILEKENSEKDKEHIKERGEIKFTIWEEPKKKVKWLNSQNKYQKIEYLYKNKEKNIEIQFLLGIQGGSWKLWCGKLGAVQYDDDPYCTFDTMEFSTAVVKALDKIEEILDEIKENPDNYIQFYVNR